MNDKTRANKREKPHEMMLRLDPKMRAALEKIAEVRGTNATELIREGIALVLDHCPTCGSQRGTGSLRKRVAA